MKKGEYFTQETSKTCSSYCKIWPVNETNLPLGRKTDYPPKYEPDVLFAVPRVESRAALGLGDDLPFRGVDIWNAWELTWLGPGKRPVVATAEIRVPATTANLIESKSLKLYLGSFAMTEFRSPTDVRDAIVRDLSGCAGGPVDVSLNTDTTVAVLDGQCIDLLEVECSDWKVDAGLLRADAGEVAEESLHTHLLRSLCPVTAQPDMGSLQVTYAGPRIDPAALLRYIVSFREHNDFHEACVERIFVDISEQCRPEKLSVYARYQRRGGIDINPYRSNVESRPDNPRLWRQ
jgi:7-cyano-7-deazaguanine reductase